ncbi:uncharacterized protein LOC111717301, partial [Eurytemora carolleeae]|uniref:uncharacterized protein LOC111717301 n=1 Tax=Eurytemora carolleeae TaxID=1294199 RepID=UPI000C75B067
MAGTDDQIAIPVEGVEGEGEQVKKERKPHVKGITFREFDHVKDFEDLVRTVVTLCSQEEQERLREMEDWLVKAEGTWVLAEGFNNFLGKVMHDEAWPSDGRVAMLRLMAYGAGEDDIVLILHMDRKDHLLMNYAQKFDRLPTKEQEALTLLFCNLFETASASEWLLYISEWDAPGGGLPLSLENQRILEEKRNFLNKDEKKTKKKKYDERIGRKGRVGEGKEEERKKTEKAEKKAEEKAVAAGQSASNSHSFKPLRNLSEQRNPSHPGILRSISCELPDPVLATPAGQLFRNKSLKRVSFDERREIINEESRCPTPVDQSEEDLPPLEEIKTSLEVSELEPSLIEPLTLHISRMAGTDDQIAIPVE